MKSEPSVPLGKAFNEGCAACLHWTSYLVVGRVVVHEGCEASLCWELHCCRGRQEAFVYLQRNALQQLVFKYVTSSNLFKALNSWDFFTFDGCFSCFWCHPYVT